MEINWKGKNEFSVGEVNFKTVDLGLGERKSSLDEFVFQKPDWMVKRYAALIDTLKPKTILELGIWLGGSCVFFHKLAQAKKLVTIDLSEQRIEAVDEYIELHNLQHSLKPIYGVDQSDILRLRDIIHEEFDGPLIDLIIDDASHFIDESRASFNALFPFMTPGGAYVIEDWPWAHGPIEFPDDTMAFYPEREPLTKLVFELILACASTDAYIEKMEVDSNSVTVWRGDGPIEAEGFDIAQCCLARGRALIGSGSTRD